MEAKVAGEVKVRVLAVASLVVAVQACQAPNPATGGGPEGSAPGASQGGGSRGTAGGSSLSFAAQAQLGELATPKVAVAAFSAKSAQQPGDGSFEDLLKDEDARDEIKPKLSVLVTGEGLPAAEGAATNAVMETRGKSTRLSKFKSFRLNLGKGVRWQGYEDLLLNKHPYDDARLRNRLAFDLFAAIKDIPAVPTVDFASLSMDGKPLGFFTRIERLDKAFLRRHQLDEQGWLYKAEQFEFQEHEEDLKLEGSPGYDKKKFESRLQVMGNKDHAPLLAFLKALNDPAVDTEALFAQQVDVDNYLSWMACNVLMDNIDTSSQNFYLYRSTKDARWRFIPWDFDAAWGWNDSQADRGARVAFLGRNNDGAANWWNMPLHRRVFQHPKLRAALVARMEDLKQRLLTPARIQSLLDAYSPVVRQAIQAEPDAASFDGKAPLAAHEAAVAKIQATVAIAQGRFLASLKRPMPFFLNTNPEVKGDAVHFNWDPASTLDGQPVTYTFILAKDPALQQVVEKKEGLTAIELDLKLPKGTYFWGVEARQGDGEWMIPFDYYVGPGSDTRYHGVATFQRP